MEKEIVINENTKLKLDEINESIKKLSKERDTLRKYSYSSINYEKLNNICYELNYLYKFKEFILSKIKIDNAAYKIFSMVSFEDMEVTGLNEKDAINIGGHIYHFLYKQLDNKHAGYDIFTCHNFTETTCKWDDSLLEEAFNDACHRTSWNHINEAIELLMLYGIKEHITFEDLKQCNLLNDTEYISDKYGIIFEISRDYQGYYFKKKQYIDNNISPYECEQVLEKPYSESDTILFIKKRK